VRFPCRDKLWILRLPDDTAIGALPFQAPMRADGVKSAHSRWAATTNGLDGPASLVLPAHNWTFCMHTALSLLLIPPAPNRRYAPNVLLLGRWAFTLSNDHGRDLRALARCPGGQRSHQAFAAGQRAAVSAR
jgi:hypothetical protein